MIQSKLSVLMAERGLKISDLYEETGISKTTLMALAENSGKGVQFDTVDKLCNFLGVTPCEFFEYSPYIVNIEESKYYSQKENNLNDLAVTVKNQFYEKTFYLSIYIDSGDAFDLPINDTDLKLAVLIGLSDNESYKNEEFFKFLSELSVAFETEFINKIINNIKEKLSENLGEQGYTPISSQENKITLAKKDKILFHLFGYTKFEMVKKVII
ncbi:MULTISPECIES: helix-turn-helix domain-containing protein [Staphylococcus]|uniref:Helix-turn-helix transcriptional regulator n=1 Tax=Staphylococcus equorum TaxID=246432 RepID=A0AAW7AI70_9STAP|nr:MULTISPECIES: helix-turn-helix transcriptional regulator [Staphylococcus]MCT1652066.1 helix-turn-helix transcriptional regulator [Staphylococcus saprophyticus]MDK9866574.1 helix-turn-helix transcriptional regulator [Staphylococcus equorum]MDW3969373.1 helix-turn-helix transcriptional regulator [Staphylococcus saprophyticus]MDW4317738.1 helix-turn-helix transcriptional regulator [Staphylococcus saprophyticus]OEK91277.1 DNA-binding protein [Staphylococcus saprophyticus]